MYAIVDIAGQQFKVEKNQKVFVHRLDAKEGSKVDFDKVLLLDDNGKVKVGTPTVSNTVVSAKVVSHLKGDKVKVFKKKRRKGYQLLNGHRQQFTELVIEDIKAAAKKTAPKAKAETATEEKEAPKKAAPKKAAAPKAEASTEAPKKKAAPKEKADDSKTEDK